MKLLLDTHIFIFWVDDPGKLSSSTLAALEDDSNELLLSTVSVWEMQIKSHLGKLQLRTPLKDLLLRQQITNNLTVLPITLTHVLALDGLPRLHHDPFDRLLVAQSIDEDLVLVTRDSKLLEYPAKFLT
jgi:PIN domain nuclease of toxin-antitoxin system